MQNEEYMFFALEQAREALNRGDIPIGAIVFLGDELISQDGNRVYSLNNSLAHAEMNMLWKIPREIIKANRGKLILATTYEPCPMCFGAALQSSVGKIIYGTNVDESGATHFKNYLPLFYQRFMSGNLQIVGGVLEEECKQIFLNSPFAEKLRKKGLIR